MRGQQLVQSRRQPDVRRQFFERVPVNLRELSRRRNVRQEVGEHGAAPQKRSTEKEQIKHVVAHNV